MRIFGLLLSLLTLLPSFSFALESKGRVNLWGLYITDDYSTTSVRYQYSQSSCENPNPANLEEIVIGKEKDQVVCSNGFCCVDYSLQGDQLSLERIISSDSGTREVASSRKIGDTFLSNLGLNAEAYQDKYSFHIDGNATASLLNERALYGNRDYRFRFTNLYAQYQEDGKHAYRVSLGRKAVVAGVLVDGVSADYLFGPSYSRDSKSIGVFGGLAPDPITKHPEKKRYTFGANFHYIPNFSTNSDSKLLIDSSIVGEMYESDFNRFYLFSRVHFTPIKALSLVGYFTLDLPASGDDGSISANHFSLQSFYRPNRKWFLSAGFSQFKIDRYLVEETVRWLTDEGSFQTARVGDRVDRSHRYRFDLKASYRPVFYVQPFVELRYERRTFDSDKRFLNDPSPNDDTDEPDLNFSLLNKKNAYKVAGGARAFPIEALETETKFSFNQRFQSRSYDVYQFAAYQIDRNWSVDAYGQIVWSRRKILDSVPNAGSSTSNATDYYLGVGGIHRILSDLSAQIRYDFSCEEDISLDGPITMHSILGRLDYRW